MDIKKVQLRLRKFAEQRDWDQFHSPKNLSMALVGEAAELLEIFQWITEEQSKKIAKSKEDKKLIEEEIADIFIYLVKLADKLDIDIENSVKEKIRLNEKKYPIEKAKGKHTKYTKL